MTLVLRRARPADAEAIVPMMLRMAAEPGNNNPMSVAEVRLVDLERAGILEIESDPHTLFLVAELEGVVVGQLTLKRWTKFVAASHGLMLGMSVDAAHRNRGIGKALLTEAIAWARASGVVRRIELHVYARNEGALRLYRSFGFELEGRRRRVFRQDDAWLDDLTMSLLID